MRSARWLLMLAVAGCIRTSSVECDDGSYCIEGTACRAITNDPGHGTSQVCADAGALAACLDAADGAPCGDRAHCHDGVCLPVACGDHRTDRPEEQCDDGNAIAGDGCSADCASNETCGNGVVDLDTGELCDVGDLRQHDGCNSVCQPESLSWIQLTDQVVSAPTELRGFASAYDAARDRVVVFGGTDTSGILLGDTWEWDGRAWARVTPVVSPLPRERAAMTYDAASRRIVMFGGTGRNGPLAETWEYDGTRWIPKAVAVTPRPRSDAAMIYDAAHQRVLLSGGSTTLPNVMQFDDLWAWQNGTWTDLSDDAPIPGGEVALAYDPSRDRVVLYGGETWEFDGATWTRRATDGPSPRTHVQLAYDAVRRQVVLFGGDVAASGPVADLYGWTGTSWTPIVEARPPVARSGAVFVTDPIHRRVVLFGGDTGTSGPDAATYLWDGTSWDLVVTRAPTPRDYGFTTATDPLVGQSTLYATGDTFDAASFELGTNISGASAPAPGDTRVVWDLARGVGLLVDGSVAPDIAWTWDHQAWTQLPVTGPSIAAGALGYDALARRAILFGNDPSETWAWDGTTWRQLAPAHSPPPRADASMAWDPIRRQLVLVGGFSGSIVFDDTWLWTGDDWVKAEPAAAPPGRSNANLVWDPALGKLILFSGSGAASTPFDDTWAWDGTTWIPLALPARPGLRNGAAMIPISDGSGLLVFGGKAKANSTGGLADVWRLRYDSDATSEACREDVDDDGDGAPGCADPDCWAVCTPYCPPGAPCDATAPRCGDGTCNLALENCRICPGDCTCDAICGDFYCDAGETHASCPGDCP